MPYKFETNKLLIPTELKRNTKLTDAQRESIREEYKTKTTSQRKLARKYNVSRRLIQFILNPAMLELNKKEFKLRQKTGMYYNKDKQREYTQNTRIYKKELNKKGLLKENNTIKEK